MKKAVLLLMVILPFLIFFGGCNTSTTNLRVAYDDFVYTNSDTIAAGVEFNNSNWVRNNIHNWTSASFIFTKPENVLTDNSTRDPIITIVHSGFEGGIAVIFNPLILPASWEDYDADTFEKEWWDDVEALRLEDESEDYVLYDGNYFIDPKLANIAAMVTQVSMMNTWITDLHAQSFIGFDVRFFHYIPYFNYRSFPLFDMTSDYDDSVDPLSLGKTFDAYSELEKNGLHTMINTWIAAMAVSSTDWPIIVGGDKPVNSSQFFDDGQVNGWFITDYDYSNKDTYSSIISVLRGLSEPEDETESLILFAGITDSRSSAGYIQYASTVKKAIEDGMFITPGTGSTWFDYRLVDSWWKRNDNDSNWQNHTYNPTYASVATSPFEWRVSPALTVEYSSLTYTSTVLNVPSSINTITVTNTGGGTLKLALNSVTNSSLNTGIDIYSDDYGSTSYYYIRAGDSIEVETYFQPRRYSEYYDYTLWDSKYHIISGYDSTSSAFLSSEVDALTVNGPINPDWTDMGPLDDWDAPTNADMLTWIANQHDDAPRTRPNDYWYNHTHGIEGIINDPTTYTADISFTTDSERMWLFRDEYMNMERAWSISTGLADSSNVVGIIDVVNFSLFHPELEPRNDVPSRIWWNITEATGITGIDDDENGYIDDYYGWDGWRNTNYVWVTQEEANYDPTLILYNQHGLQMASMTSAASNNEGWWVEPGNDLYAEPDKYGGNDDSLDIESARPNATDQIGGIPSIEWTSKIIYYSYMPESGWDNVTASYFGWSSRDGMSTEELVAEGIRYFTALQVAGVADVKVISMSINLSSDDIYDAIWEAYEEGILCVAGAGNSGDESAGGIGEIPFCMSMGVIESNYERLSYTGPTKISNYHEFLDACGYGSSTSDNGWNYSTSQFKPFALGSVDQFYTLGTNIYSTSIGGGYGRITVEHGWSGQDSTSVDGTVPLNTIVPRLMMTPALTSGATSQAAGLVSLVIAAAEEHNWGTLTPDQVRRMIQRGSVNIDSYNTDDCEGEDCVGKLGSGRLDAYRTLTLWGEVPRDTTLQGDVYISGDLKIPDGITIDVSQTEDTTIYIALDNIMYGKYYGDNQATIDIVVESGGTLDLTSSGGTVQIFPWIEYEDKASNATTGMWGSIENAGTFTNPDDVVLYGSEDWNDDKSSPTAISDVQKANGSVAAYVYAFCVDQSNQQIKFIPDELVSINYRYTLQSSGTWNTWSGWIGSYAADTEHTIDINSNGPFELQTFSVEFIVRDAALNESETYTDSFIYGESGVCPDQTAPAVVTNLSATSEDNNVYLDWDDNVEGDLVGYWVLRSTTSGGPYLRIHLISGPPVSEYDDNTAANGIQYYYIVRAVDTSNILSVAPTEVGVIPAIPSTGISVAGTISEGEVITISIASGFGVKDPAPPVLWDDLSSSVYSELVNGDEVPVRRTAPFTEGAPWYTKGLDGVDGNVLYWIEESDLRSQNRPVYNFGRKGYFTFEDFELPADGGNSIYVNWWLNSRNHDLSIEDPPSTSQWGSRIKLLRIWPEGDAGLDGRTSWEENFVYAYGYDENEVYVAEVSYFNDELRNARRTIPVDTWTNCEAKLKNSIDPEDNTSSCEWTIGFVDKVFDYTVATENGSGQYDRIWRFGADNNIPYNHPEDFYLLASDIYIDITLARIEIGNDLVYENCTHREIQIPITWVDDEITCTINQGSFANGATAWLFVITEDDIAMAGKEITFAN